MRDSSHPQSNMEDSDPDLNPFGFDDPEDTWMKHFQAADLPASLGSIGPYEVIREIGRGGQGVVYRARQQGTDHDVAVKRLIAGTWASTDMRRRFEREIHAVSTLDHPNIVNVSALDLIDGQPVLAMEWVEGMSITQWAAAAPAKNTEDAPTTSRAPSREPSEMIELFLQVCGAVHHAHLHGIIHRDLKPSNILVVEEEAKGPRGQVAEGREIVTPPLGPRTLGPSDPSSAQPKILDFGLAKLIQPPTKSEDAVTATEQFVGTPAYASPEQVQSTSDQIDIRTYIYSLGVILYEMLTGRKPYPVDGPLVDTLQSIRQTQPARPSSLARNLNRELDTILLKALAKEKEQRYQSVEAFAGDLKRHLAGEPILAHPPSVLYQLRKLAGRHRIAFISAVVMLIMLSGFAIVAFWLADAAMSAREEERRARLVAEQVSAFLGDTLASARPSRGGPDVTLLEVLKDASKRVDLELKDQPQVAAEVHYAIGGTYKSLWRWQEALPHAQQALALTRKLHDQDHENLAKCLTALGRVQTSLQNPESVALQQEALDMRRRLYGDTHPLVAQNLKELAYALHQGAEKPKYHEAEALFEKALATYKRCPGDHHREIASCLHSYGWMYARQNRLTEAIKFYKEALTIFRARNNRTNPFYAECLYGYIALLRALGRYEQVVLESAEAIPLLRKTYGESALFEPLWLRGFGHNALGQYHEAQNTYEQAFNALCLKIIEDLPQESHDLYQIRGVIARAAQEDDVPLPYQDLLNALTPLPTKARRQITFIFDLYAKSLIDSGELEKATEIYNGLMRVPPNDGREINPRLMNVALEGLANIAQKEGRTAEAHALLSDCLDILADNLPQSKMRHAQIQSRIGDCLIELGRYSEAEEYLTQSQPVLKADFGPAHKNTLAGRDRLVRLYEAWGQPDKAAEWKTSFNATPKPDAARDE
ncbi:MAG: serine/threonine-protein kinase [Phycisphaerales bacterium]|nr:serine/threonine-protein kinase [Phycisphaerales bacterium]